MLRNPSSILKACAAFALLQVIVHTDSLSLSPYGAISNVFIVNYFVIFFNI